METARIEIPVKKSRKFLPGSLIIDSWEKIKPFYTDLLNRTLFSVTDFRSWLNDYSELKSVLQEEGGWRYIRMSCDTANESLLEDYHFFINEIEPNIATCDNQIKIKLLSSAFLHELGDDRYSVYLKRVKKSTEIFRKENVPLNAQLQEKEQEYASISGAMTIEVNGKEITLPQAAVFLRDTDRKVREETFRKIAARRLRDRDALDQLFAELLELRHQVARNAGFENYRDYAFADLCRFDYTAEDCFHFHDAIAHEVVPIAEEFENTRKNQLKLDSYKPWDTDADFPGKSPLVPFQDAAELIDKTIKCFYKINPYFGERIEILRSMNYVDLGSRKGKAPGGYNYTLHEIGVPFIFMNAAGTLRDLVTMVHEGGHAVHSFLAKDLPYVGFKEIPSEVAELASMSMELISMEHWDVFFEKSDDLRRAKRIQLEKIITMLPWIAVVDKFQHWIYTHPDHTAAERRSTWASIYREFSGTVTDWSGLEPVYENTWQRQLHIFELPFYYIEYGIAQLGAIALWRNYKMDPEKTLQQYMNALKLGYTKPMHDIYKAAGIPFDFSRSYIRELADFVKNEHRKLL